MHNFDCNTRTNCLPYGGIPTHTRTYIYIHMLLSYKKKKNIAKRSSTRNNYYDRHQRTLDCRIVAKSLLASQVSDFRTSERVSRRIGECVERERKLCRRLVSLIVFIQWSAINRISSHFHSALCASVSVSVIFLHRNEHFARAFELWVIDTCKVQTHWCINSNTHTTHTYTQHKHNHSCKAVKLYGCCLDITQYQPWYFALAESLVSRDAQWQRNTDRKRCSEISLLYFVSNSLGFPHLNALQGILKLNCKAFPHTHTHVNRYWNMINIIVWLKTFES